jgi:ribonuclease H2 subunit A
MNKRCREGIEFNVDEFKRCHDVSGDHLVLGIDEAGRGPAIGPMVYCGAYVSLDDHEKLIDLCGVADSKVLNEAAREHSFSKLQDVPSFKAFIDVVEPTTISETMLGRKGSTLNTLSHQTTMNIIHNATIEGKGKLVAVYVDTVGIPETYQRLLSGRFPHLRIVVSKKADSKFPIVSAASIVAKTTRDSRVKELGIDCGSGYPSDPKTKAWLTSNAHKFFVFSLRNSSVRQSWAPVIAIGKSCIDIMFEQDLEKDDSNQPKLNFAKPPPRRDPIFSHVLGLKSVLAIS